MGFSVNPGNHSFVVNRSPCDDGQGSRAFWDTLKADLLPAGLSNCKLIAAEQLGEAEGTHLDAAASEVQLHI